MSRIVEEIANQLALDALQAADEHGDEAIVDRVADILGATSSTTQENYRTFVRVHRASQRAREYLQGLQK
ncbi:MAG: hypothetical protein CSA68_00550 [Rhodobacterales bacterium]|nr:MAG: hypothetical protein CSA68_00550 [Rhodobacterales bacterium]